MQNDQEKLINMVKDRKIVYLVTYFGKQAEYEPLDRVISIDNLMVGSMVYYQRIKNGGYDEVPTAQFCGIDTLKQELVLKLNTSAKPIRVACEQIRTKMTFYTKFNPNA